MLRLKKVLSHQSRPGSATDCSGDTRKSRTKTTKKSKPRRKSNREERASPAGTTANTTLSRHRHHHHRRNPDPRHNVTERRAAASTLVSSSRGSSSARRRQTRTRTETEATSTGRKPNLGNSLDDARPYPESNADAVPLKAPSIATRNPSSVHANPEDTTDEDEIPYAMNFSQPTTKPKRSRSGSNSNDNSNGNGNDNDSNDNSDNSNDHSNGSSESDSSEGYDSPGAAPRSSHFAEPLRPGDVVEYQNTGIYTAGSHLGRNTATILSTNADPSCKFPLGLSTGELLTTSVAVKRIGEWVGGQLYHHAGCYRPIREFRIRTRALRQEEATAGGLVGHSVTRKGALDSIKAQMEAKAVEFMRGDHEPSKDGDETDSDSDSDSDSDNGNNNNNNNGNDGEEKKPLGKNTSEKREPALSTTTTMAATMRRIKLAATNAVNRNRDNSDSDEDSDDSEVRKELERLRVKKKQQQRRQGQGQCEQQTKNSPLSSPRGSTTIAPTLAPRTGLAKMRCSREDNDDSNSDGDNDTNSEDVGCSSAKQKPVRSTPLEIRRLCSASTKSMPSKSLSLSSSSSSPLAASMPASNTESGPNSDHDYDTEEELRKAKATNARRKSSPDSNGSSSSSSSNHGNRGTNNTRGNATTTIQNRRLQSSSSILSSPLLSSPPTAAATATKATKKSKTSSLHPASLPSSGSSGSRRRPSVAMTTVVSKMEDAKRADRFLLETDDSDSDDDSLPDAIFAAPRSKVVTVDRPGNTIASANDNDNANVKTATTTATATTTSATHATATRERRNVANSSLSTVPASGTSSKAPIADRDDNDNDNDNGNDNDHDHDALKELNYDGDTSDSDDAESEIRWDGTLSLCENPKAHRLPTETRSTPLRITSQSQIKHKECARNQTVNESKDKVDTRPEWLRNLSRTATELSQPSPSENHASNKTAVGEKGPSTAVATTAATAAASTATRSLFPGNNASSRQRRYMQQEARDQSFVSNRRNDVDLFEDSSNSSSDGDNLCKGKSSYRKRNRRGELMLPSPSRDNRRNAADHTDDADKDKDKDKDNRAETGLVLVKHNHVRPMRAQKATASKHRRNVSPSSPLFSDAEERRTNMRKHSRLRVGEYQPLRLSMGKSAAAAMSQHDDCNGHENRSSPQSSRIVRKRNQKRRERKASEGEKYRYRRRKLDRSIEETDEDEDNGPCSASRNASIPKSKTKQSHYRDRTKAHREQENYDNEHYVGKKSTRKRDETKKQQEQDENGKNCSRPPPYPRQRRTVRNEREESLRHKEQQSTQENEWTEDDDSDLSNGDDYDSHLGGIGRREFRSYKGSKSKRDREAVYRTTNQTLSVSSPLSGDSKSHRQDESSTSENESFARKPSSKRNPRHRTMDSLSRLSQREPRSTIETDSDDRTRVRGLPTSPSTPTASTSTKRNTPKSQKQSRRYQLSSSSSSSEDDEGKARSRKRKKAPPATPWSTDCEVDSPPPSTVPRTSHRSDARNGTSCSRRNMVSKQGSCPPSSSNKRRGQPQSTSSVFEFLSQDENEDPVAMQSFVAKRHNSPKLVTVAKSNRTTKGRRNTKRRNPEK